MTQPEIDRIECAIRHIQTAADVDPWAAEIAVEAMRKQIDHIAESGRMVSISCAHENDVIFRQAAIDACTDRFGICVEKEALEALPSAQLERARGHWIVWGGMDIPENHGKHKCSLCGEFAPVRYEKPLIKENLSNFCPNCGARLQEGQDKDLGWTILSKSILPTLMPAGAVAGIVQNQLHLEESIHRIKQLTGISIDDLLDLLAQGYELKAPSAQPQIIRCKDCKHRDKYGCCKYWKGLAMADIPIATDDNDFCSYAEQKGEQCERKL